MISNIVVCGCVTLCLMLDVGSYTFNLQQFEFFFFCCCCMFFLLQCMFPYTLDHNKLCTMVLQSCLKLICVALIGTVCLRKHSWLCLFLLESSHKLYHEDDILFLQSAFLNVQPCLLDFCFYVACSITLKRISKILQSDTQAWMEFLLKGCIFVSIYLVALL